MMFWLPRFLISSWAAKLAPSPIASIAMTEQTPNTMPNTVSSERSRWSQRLFKPSRTLRLSRVNVDPRPAWTLRVTCLSADIAFNLAVAKADGPPRVERDVFVVGHQNDRFSLMMQVVEHSQNLLA